MKKYSGVYLVGLVFVVIVSVILLYTNQNRIDHGNKMRLESLVGHSLFQILSNYNSIPSNEPLDIEQIVEMNTKFQIIEAYSNIVDRAVGSHLLKPIAEILIKEAESIIQNYERNGEFTTADQSKYAMLASKSNEIIPILYSVYYVSDPIVEGKITLRITRYEELIEFKERLLEGGSS